METDKYASEFPLPGGVEHYYDTLLNLLSCAGADYTLVVGPGFSSGNLDGFARNNDTRLMSAEDLGDLLLCQAESILPLDLLRKLFVGGGLIDESTLGELQTRSEGQAETLGIAKLVFDATIAFPKIAMWQDIGEHAASISSHALCQSIGGQALDEFQSEFGDMQCLPDSARLDDEIAPGEVKAILDCDSSQLEAIIAARRGISFVLDGPAGTAILNSERPFKRPSGRRCR